jgi:hypothetical protein
MDGKAQELCTKRLLDMLGTGRIELLVLFGKPPVRPFGVLVLAADVIQLAEHLVAQVG